MPSMIGRTLAVALCAVAAVPLAAGAQSEAALRAALEGRSVTVKVDMPATSKGIDVFPADQSPVDWREMAERVKDNGTAVRVGQSMMITKVVVKKDSHIEVQLGGGGYGTLGDYMSNSSSVSATTESESKRERALRDSIKSAPNPTVRRQYEKELNSARSERERENSKARAEAAQANEAREANLRVKRAESGSRFNLRFKRGVPPDAMTPDGLLRILAPYAEPTGSAPIGSSSAGAAAGTTARPTSGGGLLSLKKGWSIVEVEQLLGPANSASESKEGSLTLMKRGYVAEGKRVTAMFVNGVLIDFTIAPQ